MTNRHFGHDRQGEGLNGRDAGSRTGQIDRVHRPGVAPVAVRPTTRHSALCPLGAAGTRWYVCSKHAEGVVFQAGSGLFDAVANSCPLCGVASPAFVGCACEYAAHPLDRSKRPGRLIRRRDNGHQAEQIDNPELEAY